MENYCVWQSEQRRRQTTPDLHQQPSWTSSPKAKYSYMLLCDLLKMDLYNHNDPDHLSVMDMIDDKTDLDLFVNPERPDCGLDPKLEPSSLSDFDMDTGVHPGDNFGEFDWLSGLQTAAIAQLHQLTETENTDPNLLVNPQTAIPIHLQQPSHTTQVRDAMLTDNLNSPNHNINVIVSTTPTTTLTALSLPNSIITTHNLTSMASPSKSSLLSPSESSPVLVEHLQNGIRPRPHITVSLPPQPGQTLNVTSVKKDVPEKPTEKTFPKPVYSYSCLIALALKNSQTGSLPVSEIYNFMTENFPYFKTAPDGWKNSVRHNLSLNKCFEKVENPKLSSNAKKGCLWALNPAKKEKMEEEIAKGSKKDPFALACSMAFPDRLEKIERGEAGLHYEKSLSQPSPSPMRPADVPSAPQTPKSIKTEEHFSDLHDLQVLDSNFALDTSLSDLAMQHGLWDDDLPNELTSDLNPHIAMATVGSPLVTTVSSGEDGLFGGYTGTCLYTSSPLAGLQSTSPATLTATLLSLATPQPVQAAALI